MLLSHLPGQPFAALSVHRAGGPNDHRHQQTTPSPDLPDCPLHPPCQSLPSGSRSHLLIARSHGTVLWDAGQPGCSCAWRVRRYSDARPSRRSASSDAVAVLQHRRPVSTSEVRCSPGIPPLADPPNTRRFESASTSVAVLPCLHSQKAALNRTLRSSPYPRLA
jgi:hypothetical protein